MKCVRYHYFIVVLMLVFAQGVFAAPSERAEQVRAALTEIINQHQSDSIDSRQLQELKKQLLAADPHLVLDELTPFEQSADPEVRSEAVTISWQIGHRSQSSEVRQKVVERLTKTYDEDVDTAVRYEAYRSLFSFNAADFTEQSKAYIRKYLPEPNKLSQRMILIAGVANMQDQIPLLKSVRMKAANYDALSLSEQEHFYGSAGWKARLALARMGSQEDIRYCIEMVEAYPDVQTRVTRLLDELAYIRQPETIRVIQNYLESDEWYPSRGDTPGYYYWEYAITNLARMLEDFPVKGDYSYSQEDRDTARAWMKAQTEFKIKR